MSGFADDSTMRYSLRKEFPPEQIGKLPATQKRPELDYVGHAAVTDRLNRVAPDWTYTITPIEVRGSIEMGPENRRIFIPHSDGVPHVVGVFGSMTIGGVTRQEVGEVDAYTTYGDEMKKAISDFIRRGAMRFGVALDLWSKEDLSSAGATVYGEGSNAPADLAPELPVPGAKASSEGEGGVGHSTVSGTAGRPPGEPERGEYPSGDEAAAGAQSTETATPRAPADRVFPKDPARCTHRAKFITYRGQDVCPGCGISALKLKETA